MLKNIRLLRYQRPMLETIAKIAKGSLRKAKELDVQMTSKESLQFTLTPALPIVEQYHKWLNASAKYQRTVAPHLYPQWAIPELFKLCTKYSLPLHKILNQGCRIKINASIPKGCNLVGQVQLSDIIDHDSKIRINQKIWTGPKENPMAIEADIHAVILKNNKKSFSKKKSTEVIDLKKSKLVSQIYISSKDAKNYGLISGDINPIHMSKFVAKSFGLRSSLMHGFGLKALIFEELERHGHTVDELEVKFLKPVYLNSYVKIFLEKALEGTYIIQVVSKKEDHLHLTGELKTKK